jgi:hypothetical protein
VQSVSEVSFHSRVSRVPSLSLFVALCLAFAFILPAFSFGDGQDHAELVKVATLPGGFAPYWPCGYGGHYHRGQVYGTWGGTNNDLLICEDTSDNSFRQIRPGLVRGEIYDFGYTNGDSCAEILGKVASTDDETLRLYRAYSRDSFPIHQAWKVYTPYELQYGRLCDLDGDSQQDIVASGRQGLGLHVYENRGNDQYVEVPFPRCYDDIMSVFALGDLDCDGRTELAGGNSNGHLLVYECAGDDQYARVCSLYYGPRQKEDYTHAVANDMDLNGLPELISLFRRMDTPADSCLVRIYEEPVHNQLVCVCSLTYAYNWFTGGCVASGNVDGDDRDEFAVSTGIDVRLFKSFGLHQYAQTWQINWSGVTWMRFFDINADGRSELLISRSDSTYILEDTSGLGTAIFEKRTPQYGAVSVQPTVTRLGAPVQFSGVPPGSDIEVLSLDGRLVSRTRGVRQSEWSWNLRNQSGSLVPAGTYFAVIRSKGKATSLKLCVVK